MNVLNASILHRTVAALVSVFLPVASAFASSSAHGEPSIADLTVYWANFVVYSIILYVLLRKPLANGWAARRARIQESVASCTSQVASAERELNAVEALTKGLTSEQDRARAEIVAQAKLEAEQIVESARAKATRIREQAKDMVAGEGRSAESTFRTTLVTRALELARAKFVGGEFSSKQQSYLDAAVGRAKRLVQ
jgi:F0F1-type ATP synthase membrane subunit b/b'